MFVLCESFLMGTITAAVNTDILLLAAAITTGVTLMCTAFAMQTRYDLTQWTGTMYVVLWALIFALLFNLFFPTRTFNIVVSAAGAVIFSLYLIYDIQLLMGGRHMFRISPDEYVFATLNLYLDVLNLFLFILRLLQSGTHQ